MNTQAQRPMINQYTECAKKEDKALYSKIVTNLAQLNFSPSHIGLSAGGLSIIPFNSALWAPKAEPAPSMNNQEEYLIIHEQLLNPTHVRTQETSESNKYNTEIVTSSMPKAAFVKLKGVRVVQRVVNSSLAPRSAG